MTASPRPTNPPENSGGRTAGRILWLTVKLLVVPALCLIALVFGLAVGYAVLGGRPVSEVFELNTWKHIYDLVFAES
ncbi:DNA-directed RNA polymerase subunit beta [Cohnella pontilimi]|uniref:DNA-directed RNA polymerase subunit beta n=1 Tax=Cohnella pontilimi TaxID=2564100 RepID=A0A4V5LS75_9BACL|nr:DNA-directed RNA polymerase subunit beta [Cohnella pontilimi]TJY41919.1 DNA-directed RNA polymerase subunit beta [Cohnella pontilimi]